MTKKLYKLMNWAAIEGIVYSEEDNPHALLGPHAVTGGIMYQFYYPEATKAVIETKKELFRMELADEEGYFAALLPKGTNLKGAQIEVTFEDGTSKKMTDPYQFAPSITKADTDLFAKGIHYEIYQVLGAHEMEQDGVKGVRFAVWAPNAMRVSVVGDFNGWDGRVHQMSRLWDSGIFELFIPDAKPGDLYKYEIKIRGGLTFLKADPYAFSCQVRPETASVVAASDAYTWKDSAWVTAREQFKPENSPINIYELYLGSFARKEPKEGVEIGDASTYYTYRELAPKLVSYIKKMGYTHVEFMPVMEHPLDASWGYQVSCYYAPTSRYGSPDDLRFLIDSLHQNDIGVILDWVPAHFPKDAHGLAGFDGTSLYEHADPLKQTHPDWGTMLFNYARPQVSNFLIANALYWIKEFHADGIRVDAVASMLYLDYGRQDGQWRPNMYGGKEDLDAIEFIKHLNSVVHKQCKGALMVAEESTAWPKVTGDVKDDGLGFDLKWNMGWMNDFLDYIRKDPIYRSGAHGELTFSMIYQYSEKFAVILSHDEVVHGKATMIGKMPGNRKEQFANLRAAYGYMMTHPGKKLLFMGQELAEYDEWNENRSVHWELEKEEDHKQMQAYVKALNSLYKENPALYKLDHDPEGFEWINCISANENVLVFVRKSGNQKDTLVVVVNFANVAREAYTIGVPYAGKYKEVFNSDAKAFGGNNMINKTVIASTEKEWDDREDSITFVMPPLSVQVFSYTPFTKKEQEEIEEKKADARKRKAEVLKLEQASLETDEARRALEEAKRLMEDASNRAKDMERRAKEAKKQALEMEKAFAQKQKDVAALEQKCTAIEEVIRKHDEEVAKKYQK